MGIKIVAILLSGLLVSCQFWQRSTPSSVWNELAGWSVDNHAEALQTFVKGCEKIQHKPTWQNTCQLARRVAVTNRQEARAFFEKNFRPHCLQNSQQESAKGLITGYYEPLLQGSRQATNEYRHPIYAVPDDLLRIDLSEVHSKFNSRRLRGRLIDGNKVVPYWTREIIHSSRQPLAGDELLWVNDPIALFFLHVQGSGLVQLDDGTVVAVNYANDNGHIYQSIGKHMVKQSILPLESVNLFTIRQWLFDNPDKADALLNINPKYIFFRETAVSSSGPIGSLGVELTPQRSLAVDVSIIDLGSPVWLDSTMPDNAQQPLQRLMVAQDTGGAIQGEVRADVFWGRGTHAEKMAGLMKNEGKLCVLLPHS